MIETIATRRTSLNGKPIAKGEKVPMPLQQFQDLESTGLFERAPADKKSTKTGGKTAASTPVSVDQSPQAASGEATD